MILYLPIFIAVLEIYFSHDKRTANNKNFIRLIIDSRALLNIWNKRWLSLYSKIQVFKSDCVQASYFATINKVPEDY